MNAIKEMFLERKLQLIEILLEITYVLNHRRLKWDMMMSQTKVTDILRRKEYDNFDLVFETKDFGGKIVFTIYDGVDRILGRLSFSNIDSIWQQIKVNYEDGNEIFDDIIELIMNEDYGSHSNFEVPFKELKREITSLFKTHLRILKNKESQNPNPFTQKKVELFNSHHSQS